MNEVPARPTLWRTCRVLANGTRLRILQALLPDRRVAVQELAAELGLSVPLVSRYARSLNARGMVCVTRVGASVFYAPARAGLPEVVPLALAVQAALRNRRRGPQRVYRLATAFTHPRRVRIVRACLAGPLSAAALARRTRIPKHARLRHLRKLEARGILEQTDQRIRLARPTSALHQALLDAAGRMAV